MMFLDSNKDNIFFTSDLHFDHKNVIKYCNRPFQNIHEMNERIIDTWNNKVKESDYVFILGDMSFSKNPENIIERLNGKLCLIPGNHDGIHIDSAYAKLLKYPEKFDIAPPLYELSIRVEDENLLFILCHYAMKVWNKSHYGSIHLYGHSHGTLPDDTSSRSMDVGIDTYVNEAGVKTYEPYHLDEILLKMYRKSFSPVDHHRG